MKGLRLKAGNTIDTLKAVSVTETNEAAPTRGLPDELEAVPDTILNDTVESVSDEVEYVTRKEYSDLRDAFLRLVERIDRHNANAPHKI